MDSLLLGVYVDASDVEAIDREAARRGSYRAKIIVDAIHKAARRIREAEALDRYDEPSEADR